jgi:trk system potassium uptake protein
VNNIMIVGGGMVGSLTAARLEKKFNVKLFEMNMERSVELSDILDDTLVINGDARDITLLEDEGVRNMDAFIAVTNNSETNILTCLLARKFGVKKTIAWLKTLILLRSPRTSALTPSSTRSWPRPVISSASR